MKDMNVNWLQEKRPAQWIDMHNMRVIQYGSVLHIDAHMTLPWYYNVRDAEYNIHAVEDMVREKFGSTVEMFVHIDGCMPYSCKLCAITDCPVRQEVFQHQLEWTLENMLYDQKHGKNTAQLN